MNPNLLNNLIKFISKMKQNSLSYKQLTNMNQAQFDALNDKTNYYEVR